VRISRLVGVVTPNERFYIRSHFPVPEIDPASWRLAVHGLVRHPQSFGLADLLNMPSQSMTVTLECAGNGRAFFNPPIEGEQWALGAAGTAEWTGVPLAAVLERAGIESNASELIFRGADAPVSGAEPSRFERGLSVKDAHEATVLLAYAMNGDPLPVHHGFPLRVIVPGWYGVASVKWLNEIQVTDVPFQGYFHSERYYFAQLQGGNVSAEPVTRMRVRSLITQPEDGESIKPGHVAIKGLAWSGTAHVSRVDVSVGGEWKEAHLQGHARPNSWRRWELITRIDQTGEVKIRARAHDATGQVQPEQADWNRLGYGNNSIQTITVQVESGARDEGLDFFHHAPLEQERNPVDGSGQDRSGRHRKHRVHGRRGDR
jgi:DMSO/TMAO reductase YedYZ molybdopterin-dependent catalytic subunit